MKIEIALLKRKKMGNYLCTL